MFIGTKAQLIEHLKTLPNDETIYDFEKHRFPKSKDAEAYFHVLRDKLSAKLGTSRNFMKNVLVAKYGKALHDNDGDPMMYKTNAPPDFMMELQRPHTSCFKETVEDGKTIYWYWVYEETKNLNSKDYSILIDGTVEDCKEQGIETMPEDKLAQLMSAWKANYG